MAAGYFCIVESGLPSAQDNGFLLLFLFLLRCSYVLSSETLICFYLISYTFAPLDNILLLVGWLAGWLVSFL